MIGIRTRWIVWTPRILSILFIGFISMFALDVFEQGRPWMEILGALLIHLVPVYVLVLILALAWKRPLAGAIGYLALALAYCVFSVQRGHWDWSLIIAGPLLVVAALFLLSWRTARRAATSG